MLSLAIFGFEQKVLPDTMEGFALNVSLLPVHKSSNALKERLSCLRLALSHLSIRRRCFWISLFVLMSLTVTALLACGFLQWHSALPVNVLLLDSASSRLPEHLIPENYFTGPPTVYFRDSLHNDTRYITSFLSAGFTNDVMTLGNLIYLALITSRVAILPPFTSHIRSIAAPLPFSEIFDVPRLITALNAPVLEWSQVKDLEAAARQDVQDIIGCWNVWEVDNVGADGPRGSFTPHLLNLHISYTRAPPDIKLMAGYEHDSHSTFWSLARLAFPEARAEVLARPDLNPTRPSEWSDETRLPDEQVVCYDYLYYMCAITPWEFEKDYSPAWRDVVRHFRWTPDLEELAKTYLRHMLQIPEGAVIPPFVTVHVRHSDFGGMCGNVPYEECFAPLSAYARRVREVQEELRDFGVNATHVIMTSDEEDERWWDEVSAQGWLRINHTLENTEERFGDWGPWYMVVLDAVVQSLGIGFVGTDRSTFSIMARRRVIDWNGGVSRMVMWGRANADDH